VFAWLAERGIVADVASLAEHVGAALGASAERIL
jgi:hypothetical protein